VQDSLRRCLISLGVFAAGFGLEAPVATAQDVTSRPLVAAKPQAQTTAQLASAPRRASNSAKRYFIEFRSRAAASYGHTYVVHGRLNERGEIAESQVAGLHPAGDREDCENCSLLPWLLGHIVPVPAETGASDGDLEEQYVTARWRILLAEAEYRKITADIKRLQASSPVWHAFLINCNAFGGQIAQAMGLQIPFWVQYPEDFINTLREMNGGGPPQPPLKEASKSLKRSHAQSVQSARTSPPPVRANDSVGEISRHGPTFDSAN
jgi:hypothetical protein